MRPTCIAVALLWCGSGLALADEVPGFSTWSQYRFSLDPTPMRVVFVHEKASKGVFPDLVIPRAYVFYAHRAPPSGQGPLPAVLETNQVELLFVDGTGEAWSIAVDARARWDRTDRHTAAAAMRAQVYDVRLSSTTDPNQAEDVRTDLRRWPLPAEPVEGLEHYRSPATSASYFVGGEGEDAFWSAHCYNPTHPDFFCTYQMPVTDGVVATVKFVDFRLHGGRAEANRRLRFAREVVCRYLERC